MPRKKKREQSELQKRMREAMTLAGFAPSTQDCYAAAVRMLVDHFGRRADLIGDEDVRAYLLSLRERELADSTINQRFGGIRFFYRNVLDQDFGVFAKFRCGKEEYVPACLTHEEVKRVLAEVRDDRYRTLLTVTYGCGLRISEACGLRTEDVLSGQRQLLIRKTKTKRQRLVPLPERVYQLMRQCWSDWRPPAPWLFANSYDTNHASSRTVQLALKAAVAASGVNEKCGDRRIVALRKITVIMPSQQHSNTRSRPLRSQFRRCNHPNPRLSYRQILCDPTEYP